MNSTTLADASFARSAGTTAVGKHAPYVPRWRAMVVATCEAARPLAQTVAGRDSGRTYSTLGNTDNTADVFAAFDTFFELGVRADHGITDHLSASLGVDHLNSRPYFLYHPYPPRTVVGELHLKS